MALLRRNRNTLFWTVFLCFTGFVSLWRNASLHRRHGALGRRREAGTNPVIDDHELFARHGKDRVRTTNASFSACLLIMDDNHFLIEWLAYHYHVLPLRNLIVAVDPRSQTSPKEILERWNGLMNITVWNDDNDYIKDKAELDEAEEWVAIKFANDKPNPTLIRHRARQRLFYYHCLQEHKKVADRSYTLLTDSDEFLTVNYKTVEAVYGNSTYTAPPISEPGSVLKMLEYERQHPAKNAINFTNNNKSPCIQIPRSRFGAVETSEIQTTFVPADLHDVVNASQLATLRWRHHADPANYQQNRISKVILDVSGITVRYFRPVDSIHRPVKQYCGRRKLHIRANQQLLLIHHYLGTWEQYNYRQDSRVGNERSRTMYQKTAILNQGTSDMVTPWLKGFVESVGTDRARYLLKDVGRLEPKSRGSP